MEVFEGILYDLQVSFRLFYRVVFHRFAVSCLCTVGSSYYFFRPNKLLVNRLFQRKMKSRFIIESIHNFSYLTSLCIYT